LKRMIHRATATGFSPHTRHQPADEVVRAAAPATTLTRPGETALIAAESGFNPNAVSAKGAGVNATNATDCRLVKVYERIDPASNVERWNALFA